MSIIVSGIKLGFEVNEEQAVKSALKILKAGKYAVKSARIYKKSIDLRYGNINKVYSVVVNCENEQKITERLGRNDVRLLPKAADIKITGERTAETRPIVAGFGPAGMFAALVLAENGYRPIVLEKGGAMDKRDRVTQKFFETGQLDENTNVQYGEGGAGTYSDGKLTTRIHDSRARLVTKYLLEHGAPPEIDVMAKPHIGTDLLKGIVVSVRKRIIELGGEVLFDTPVKDIKIQNGAVCSVVTDKGEIPAENVILAVGHSARDIYKCFFDKKIDIIAKNFAVGVRIEHLQETINRGLYGKWLDVYDLPQGEYSLAKTENGRGCYTFCMCPGGHVMACASEAGGTVVNGMSYHARDGKNANSAVVVTVSPSDFGDDSPLKGIEFQRKLEKAAFETAGGQYKAPVQLFGDFEKGKMSTQFGEVSPTYNRGVSFCDINKILPGFITREIKDSVKYFGRKIKGFDGADSVLTAVESRTSAPVRIVRDEKMESTSCTGLIPCGEGAGYAGGIMSAAVDGIRAAESLMSRYRPKES